MIKIKINILTISLIISLILLLILIISISVSPNEDVKPLKFVKNDILKYDKDFRKNKIPDISNFTARDGVNLAFRYYEPVNISDNNTIAIINHGSSANSTSTHLLSHYLSENNVEVYSMDVRGHYKSGENGHIKYIGQLEDDLEDLIKKIKSESKNFNKKIVLIGFSSGGGFVLRVASEDLSRYFDKFISLSPMISPFAPTYRKDSGGWAYPSMPRIMGLLFLNQIGISHFNYLPVLRFALDKESIENMNLTPVYDFNLQQNYGLPARGYEDNLKSIKKPTFVLIGSNDEMFYADQFAPMMKESNPAIEVKVIKDLGHIEMSLNEVSFVEILNIIKR